MKPDRLTEERVELEAEITSLQKQLAECEDNCRCPQCGCASPDDAESKECGCDAPVCKIEAGDTLAKAYERVVGQLKEARNVARRFRGPLCSVARSYLTYPGIQELLIQNDYEWLSREE